MNDKARNYVWKHYQSDDPLEKIVMLIFAMSADDNGVVEYVDYDTFKAQVFDEVGASDVTIEDIEQVFSELHVEKEVEFWHTPPQLKMIGYLRWLEVQS